MMFKDQNRKLSGQNKPSTATGLLTPSAPPRKVPKIFFEICPDLQSELSLIPSWGDQATSFVFANYVSEDNESASSRGLLDYLPALYRRAPPEGILADAVIALGLVGIANANRDSTLLSKAILKYGATAQVISARLENVELAKRDDTLISVLLLGLFEVSLMSVVPDWGRGADLVKNNASDQPRSMASWLQHMRGAMSLLKLRGDQQLETHIGRRLFVQMRTNVVSHLSSFSVHILM
jgi:hypothetical protein